MYPTYAAEKPITMTGSDLEMLNVVINESPGSVIVEYQQLR